VALPRDGKTLVKRPASAVARRPRSQLSEQGHLSAQASEPALGSAFGGGGRRISWHDEEEGQGAEGARGVGAPAGAGALARRVRGGEVFGDRAVMRRGAAR